MEKGLLESFSKWAKENLEKQIEVSLKSLGINGDNDFVKAKKVGDYTVIDGDPTSYPASLYEKRNEITKLVDNQGYKNVIEEFAYTWFNRLVALRFMEVHDYLPHGFRILSSRDGGIEPEILKNLGFVKDDLKLDVELCANLREQGKIEELFRYVLFSQCNALADILPMLFDKEHSFLELLLPKNLLKGETVITRMLEIPEEDFLNEIEIIGWLYQFYNAAKKKAVNDSKKTITKDTLPAVTQLFTPDWIVRYLAENSVGRLWLESYPNSSLKSEMKYYVDDPEQTEEVQRKLDAIKYKNVNPEEIKIIEPCCGSGHILVYVFDLLYKMYEEKGYQKRDIPTLILSKNLTGLDVDKRASQLASFSLIMKAREMNNRFFSETYYVVPRVYEIKDSTSLIHINYKKQIEDLHLLNEEERNAITYLVESFRYGKTIGSLLKLQKEKYALAEQSIKKIAENGVSNIFIIELMDKGIRLLKELLSVAEVLTDQYDVMITNPPYIGSSSMEQHVKDYATTYYPRSKSDMYAMFMETEFLRDVAYTAMVNMHGWMSLSSFERLREELLFSKEVVTMIHLGTRAFEMISGEVVQTTAFVMQKHVVGRKGIYFNLTESQEKEKTFRSELKNQNERITYYTDYFHINRVPGKMFTAYWVTDNALGAFSHGTLSKIFETREGMATANNDLFLRFWYELQFSKITFDCENEPSAIQKRVKWVPYNKGGATRDWYGNNDYVVNWSNNGYEIKHNIDPKTKRVRSHNYNGEYGFRKGLTWSAISSGAISVRYSETGFLFDSKGAKGFCNTENELCCVLGLLNSKVAQLFLKFLSPTLDYKVGDVIRIPFFTALSENINILETVKQQISISKDEWDSFEESWDFVKHPLVVTKHERQEQTYLGKCSVEYNEFFEDLSKIFECWEHECKLRFDTLKENEEKLNSIFIDSYNLCEELSPKVEDTDITIRLADKERDIKSLISYFIGLVMGRYSLDFPGLTYAGGIWDEAKYQTYKPDDDGIVPIYNKIGMEDGLTGRIIELIKLIYGEDTYRQNIDFIAEALGKKSSESSEETLNRYLNDGFYSDHLKVYQKRPIYWMFSSGKNSGFKCLIYMHRYNSDTLAAINGKYFLPESTRLKNELDELNVSISTAEGRDKIKLENERQKIAAAYNEAIEYGQVLDHVANKFIDIDLDDGVKVNYAKFQNVELVTDAGTKVKKDLLVPIK